MTILVVYSLRKQARWKRAGFLPPYPGMIFILSGCRCSDMNRSSEIPGYARFQRACVARDDHSRSVFSSQAGTLEACRLLAAVPRNDFHSFRASRTRHEKLLRKKTDLVKLIDAWKGGNMPFGNNSAKAVPFSDNCYYFRALPPEGGTTNFSFRVSQRYIERFS